MAGLSSYEFEASDRFTEFVSLIHTIHKEMLRIRTLRAQQLGMQGADVMCLYVLEHAEEPLTAARLAQATDVSRAALSRTVARLESLGFLERGATDAQGAGYRTPLLLTKAGHLAAQLCAQSVAEVLESTAQALSDEERLQLYEYLRRIAITLKPLT